MRRIFANIFLLLCLSQASLVLAQVLEANAQQCNYIMVRIYNACPGFNGSSPELCSILSRQLVEEDCSAYVAWMQNFDPEWLLNNKEGGGVRHPPN